MAEAIRLTAWNRNTLKQYMRTLVDRELLEAHGAGPDDGESAIS